MLCFQQYVCRGKNFKSICINIRCWHRAGKSKELLEDIQEVDGINQVFSMFVKGGFVMWPLLLCSVIVVAIAVDRGLYFRRINTDVASLKMLLGDHLHKGNWEKVREICGQTGGIQADILSKAFTRQITGASQLEQRIDNIAAVVMDDLRYRLEYLDTIVTLAPLLGLLGTVTGMIRSFSVFSLQEGQPLMITGGIGEALIATATGLCVAIFALIIQSYFSHRVNVAITDVERLTNYVLDAVPGRRFHEDQ